MANERGKALLIDARRTGYNPDQVTRTTTIAELIDILNEMGDAYGMDTKVFLSHDNGYTYGGIEWGDVNFATYDEDRVYCDEYAAVGNTSKGEEGISMFKTERYKIDKAIEESMILRAMCARVRETIANMPRKADRPKAMAWLGGQVSLFTAGLKEEVDMPYLTVDDIWEYFGF